jgi:pimeloyl-ACP methyl ester carboxylesterase
VEEFHAIGLSGGGPYALATSAAMPDRVRGIEVLGGVAPTVGSDAVGGGTVGLFRPLVPLVEVGRLPLSFALTNAIRMIRPFAGAGIDLYRVVQPAGDKRVLGRPEFKAMFLDDIVNGSRKQISAPLADLLLFTRHWGFELSEVVAPVRWWHGDADHIVPWEHGRHCVSRLPEAELLTIEGESHLIGMSLVEDILSRFL